MADIGGKVGREMASARVTVEKGVVGYGLDYACAHIIIPAEISSVNLLPIPNPYAGGVRGGSNEPPFWLGTRIY